MMWDELKEAWRWDLWKVILVLVLLSFLLSGTAFFISGLVG